MLGSFFKVVYLLVYMASLEEIVLALGQVGLWIQAVGILVIIWIIVQVITMYFNRRRRLLLEEINKRLKRVESKINKILFVFFLMKLS